MKKRILSILMCMCLVCGVLPVTASFAAETSEIFAGGDGTKDSPYLIATKEQLSEMCHYLDSHFKLVADITFDDNDDGWIPVGKSSKSAFTGSFDGDGHTIKNLKIDVFCDTVYVGLFGCNEGTIKNLTMSNNNAYYEPYKDYVGGIVGSNYGTILNCHNTGVVSSLDSAGGIAAFNSGQIRWCSNSGFVIAMGYVTTAGGIAGYNEGTIEKSYNEGTIRTDATSSFAYSGGIVGQGQKDNVISNCYNTGTVSAYASGGNVGPRPTYCGGGIVGYDYLGSVECCYNAGAISGRYDLYGGIAGQTSSNIKNCYYLETVPTGLGSSMLQNAPEYIKKCTVKCTAEEMQNQYTFVGFDFNNLWVMSEHENGGYPKLNMQGGKLVESIEITSLPHKRLYKEGEQFEPAGLVVTAMYDTGDKSIITNYDVDADFSTFGEKTVTVMCGGKTATFIAYVESNAFSGGLGTEEYPFLIGSKEELDKVRSYSYACYRLIADIIFAADDFASDGAFYNYGAGWSPINYFCGVFDGDGHTITGLDIRDSMFDRYGGLFGDTSGAIIKNLNLTDVSISISQNTSYSYIGGIVGEADDTSVSNCSFEGTIISDNDKGSSFIGGIIGAAKSSSVSNCYSTAEVSATGKSDGVYVGGIVGYARAARITNCYNTGSIGSEYSAGGIVGGAYPVTTNGSETIIRNCYNVGHISGNFLYTGAICGYLGDIDNCYYLDNTSDGTGRLVGDIGRLIKCTDAELKNQGTFIGFNFTDVWTMAGDKNYLYPELQAVLMNTTTDEDKVIEITVNTPTGTTVTAPIGGWKEGENTFTVSSDKVCRVFASYDGGQTYIRLTASAAGNDHSFTAGNMTADTILTVLAAGDVSGDGSINIVDISKLCAASLGKTSLTHLLTANADTNGDGQINIVDISKLCAVSLGKSSLNW